MKEIKVGNAKWIEAYAVMIHGKAQDGSEIAISQEPFRTKADAVAWARAKYPRFRRSVMVTMVEKPVRWKLKP